MCLPLHLAWKNSSRRDVIMWLEQLPPLLFFFRKSDITCASVICVSFVSALEYWRQFTVWEQVWACISPFGFYKWSTYLHNLQAAVLIVVLVSIQLWWSNQTSAHVSSFGTTIIFAWRTLESSLYLWYAKNRNEEGVGGLCWLLSRETTGRCWITYVIASATCVRASWRWTEKEARHSELSCHRVPQTLLTRLPLLQVQREDLETTRKPLLRLEKLYAHFRLVEIVIQDPVMGMLLGRRFSRSWLLG